MNTDAKSKVAVVRCSSYDRKEVERAVAKAVHLLGGFGAVFSELTRGSRIVLKPNLLTKAEPEKAVTTHPEVFRAVGTLLKEAGYVNLVYGDSQGNPMHAPEKTAESCGIKAVADELRISMGDFDRGRKVSFPEGSAARQFVLCNEIANLVENPEQAGGIVNICKMKTHQLERITGAVKNTFGCVYGMNKPATHASFESPEHFAKMLADLNRLVKPQLHIMDGILAMEGNGPGSGDPIHMYVILASTDPVALDTTFCNLINLDPALVATNTAAAEAGVGNMDEEKIEVLLGNVPMRTEGEVITMDELASKFGEKDFRVERGDNFRGGFRIMKFLAPLIHKRPVVVPEKCVGCGICVEACPVVPGKDGETKPIRLIDRVGTGSNGKAEKEGKGVKSGKVATYDYSECIGCYCCQEMCPEKAIATKKSLLLKIIDRRWEM